MIGEMTTVADITIKAGGVKNAETAKLSNDEIEKRNKKQKELEQLFTDANTAIEAGNLDEAITKLTQMTTEMPKCAPCFAKLGDIYVKKNDLTNAEPAYLKAIEIDPKQAGVYNALASVYNSQKKFDDAAKMSAKANELAGRERDRQQSGGHLQSGHHLLEPGQDRGSQGAVREGRRARSEDGRRAVPGTAWRS